MKKTIVTDGLFLQDSCLTKTNLNNRYP